MCVLHYITPSTQLLCVHNARGHQFLELERNGMAMALAGDAQLNSGATGVALLSAQHTLLKWVLRDTMLLAFNSALDGSVDPHPWEIHRRAPVRLLIELALLLTSDEIA
jgi:hypothetical protein